MLKLCLCPFDVALWYDWFNKTVKCSYCDGLSSFDKAKDFLNYNNANAQLIYHINLIKKIEREIKRSPED